MDEGVWKCLEGCGRLRGTVDFVEMFTSQAEMDIYFQNETLMVADPKAIQYLFHTSAYHSPKTKDVRVFSKLLGGRGIGG